MRSTNSWKDIFSRISWVAPKLRSTSQHPSCDRGTGRPVIAKASILAPPKIHGGGPPDHAPPWSFPHPSMGTSWDLCRSEANGDGGGTTRGSFGLRSAVAARTAFTKTSASRGTGSHPFMTATRKVRWLTSMTSTAFWVMKRRLLQSATIAGVLLGPRILSVKAAALAKTLTVIA